MSRRDEPNASQCGARYAERKRAAERERDARALPSSCNRCATARMPGSIFCSTHAAEYERLRETADMGACLEFTRRIYWP